MKKNFRSVVRLLILSSIFLMSISIATALTTGEMFDKALVLWYGGDDGVDVDSGNLGLTANHSGAITLSTTVL